MGWVERGVVLLGVLTGGVGCQSGERWTIECLGLEGSDHRMSADGIADVLRQTRGVRSGDVRVEHEPGRSFIYYGTYHRNIDRVAGEREIPRRLRDDLELIKELVDGRGRRMFLGARMVREPLADIGRAEWDLRNASGLYTLQVGVYFPTEEVPNYKQAAADHVAALRAKGYEAYYYHTPANSIVTVGLFGREAIVDHHGQAGYSGVVRQLQRKEMFAYNLTNGAIWHQIAEGQKAPVRSRLVLLPQHERDSFVD